MKPETLAALIRKELDLKARAHDDALSGQPPSNATGLTWTEIDIVNRVRHEREKRIGELDDEIRKMACFLDWHADEPSDARERLTGLVESHANEKSPASETYENAKRGWLQAQEDLNVFKATHNLNRNARVPVISSRLLIGCIALIVTVEGLLNMFFFEQVKALGGNPLDALLQAFIVSGVNVGFAFLGGRVAWPQLLHRERGWRIVGVFGVLAAIATIVLINLMAAQYLGMLELDKETPGQAAIDSLYAGDFSGAFNSVHSVFLMLVGFLCACFSARMACVLDDPYPGYGDMHRIVELARANLDDREDEVGEDIQRRRTNKLKAVDEIEDRQTNLAVELAEKLVVCKALRREVDGCLGGQFSALARDLLVFYRDENRKARASQPPDYFHHYPEGKELEGDAHVKETLEKEITNQERRAAVLRDEIRGTMREVVKARDKIGTTG